MTVTSTDSSFSAMTVRRLPLMKRSLKRSLDRAETSSEGLPLSVHGNRGFVGVRAGHGRRPVCPQAPFLDQKHLVAIDADGLAFGDHQGWPRAGSASWLANTLMSHRKVPAWRNGIRTFSQPAACQQPAADEQLDGRDPVDPAPIEARRGPSGHWRTRPAGCRRGGSAAPGRRASRPAFPGLPGRRLRVPRRAWIATGGGPCAALLPGSSRPSEAAPNPAISARRSMRKKSPCHEADADHF